MLKFFDRIQSKICSHVVLYHSTYSQLPTNLSRNSHNVSPEDLHDQLAWYKHYFDFVWVDELANGSATGKIAVTFDDAYDCVFTEAVPILEFLKVPATIYINGASLQGKPFWRDKIRLLISRELVEEFLSLCGIWDSSISFPPLGDFYSGTKSRYLNSKHLDTLLDRFLSKKGIPQEELLYCVRDRSRLVDHPLLAYGNHTYSHYLLSSLTEDEQEVEITANHELLESLPGRKSRLFSIPFGGKDDFDSATVRIAAALGYTGLLYSRNLLQISWPHLNHSVGLPHVERFMAEPSLSSLRRKMPRLLCRSVAAKFCSSVSGS